MTSPPGNDLARRAPAPGIVPASEPEVIVRVRDPAQLVILVPYQLGFQPATGDMVVMGTVPPTNRVRLTLRWDLPDPGVPVLAAARARDAVAAFAAEGCTHVAAVGFGPDRLVAPSVTALREAAREGGLEILELLRAEDGRYWSYRCTGPECCPPDGTPYSPAGNPVAGPLPGRRGTGPGQPGRAGRDHRPGHRGGGRLDAGGAPAGYAAVCP
jgi:hypothetical protein